MKYKNKNKMFLNLFLMSFIFPHLFSGVNGAGSESIKTDKVLNGKLIRPVKKKTSPLAYPHSSETKVKWPTLTVWNTALNY